MTEPCAYCDRPMDMTGAQNWAARTRDHIVPKLLGGTRHPLNLVDCCKECNHLKGSHTPESLRVVARDTLKRAQMIARMADRIDNLIAERRPEMEGVET